MENKENAKLFIILIFSFSLIVLLNNFTNPLFRLKAQLAWKNWLAQSNKDKEPAANPQLSIGFVQKPSQTTVPQPTSLPTLLPSNLAPSVLIPSPTVALITSTPILPKPINPTNKPTIAAKPTLKNTPTSAAKTELVWQSVFKGVSAATNQQDNTLTVKVNSGTKYIKRTYTLKDGRKIEVLTPLFKK